MHSQSSDGISMTDFDHHATNMLDDRDNPRPWTSLFAFTHRRHAPVLSAALLLSLLGGLVVPGMAVLLGKIFGLFAAVASGELESNEFMMQVSQCIIYLVIVGLTSWASNGAFFTMWLWFGEQQAASAREQLFERMISQELRWFETRENGVTAILAGCQTQISEMQTAVSQPAGYALQAVIVATVSFGVAVYHCWELTLVVLAVVPVGFLVLTAISARIQPYIDRHKEFLERASCTATTAITSIETVKAFNGQAREAKEFEGDVKRAAGEHKELAHLNAVQMGFITFLTFLTFVMGFWYGNSLMRKEGNGVTPAAMMTAIWSCLSCTHSLEAIMPQLLILEKGKVAGAGLRALLDEMKVTVGEERRGEVIPPVCRGEIEIMGISFEYPSRASELTLDCVNMTIPAGKITFIVGRSGSGKSTLGSLIVGSYNALSGAILIDGHPIQTLDPRWIRDNVSLIHQQSVLFNETVFRNISFGRNDYENVTDVEVLDACKMAAFEQTISELPYGLNTVAGAGGKQLSGGQLQRVALARDHLRDAPVLILDESLSSLDIANRITVLSALRRWRQGKTTIIITHEISEILEDDYAFVMEYGKVVQRGYRNELEASDGAFRRFVAASRSVAGKGRQLRSVLEKRRRNIDKNLLNKTKVPRTLSEFRVVKDKKVPRIIRDSRRSDARTSRDLHMVGLHFRANRTSGVFERFEARSCDLDDTDTDNEDDPGSHRHQPISERPLKRKRTHRNSSRRKQLNLIFIFHTLWTTLVFKQKAMLIFGFIAALFHAAATPVFSFFFARLLMTILDLRTPPSMATTWSIGIAGIALVDALCCYFMYFFLETVAQAWVDYHRTEAFRRVLDQPYTWFFRDKNTVSRIVDDLEKHGEEMRNLVARFAGYMFVGIGMSVIGVIWAMTSSWRLTLIGLCITPVFYGISVGMGKACEKYEALCNDAAQSTGAILHESIANIRTVRNYRLERYFRQKYFRATAQGMKTGMQRSAAAGFWFGLSDSIIFFGTALLFYYGALLITRRLESLANIVNVFTLLLFSLSSANSIIGLIPQLAATKDSARRIFRLSSLPLTSHEHIGTLPPPSAPTIIFKNITFTYPTRPLAPVLQNLSLTLPSTASTAIVGASGAGKSTVTALLQRLHLPDSGCITFSDRPLSEISTPLLRNHLAVVNQSPTLFPVSLAENIAYPYSLPQSDIEAAAKLAGLHSWICSLPEGYRTVLGTGGNGISGGQAQRVAIARALVRRPGVLLLDECTSNLDTESARAIRETVAELVERDEMTVVVVTHEREMMKVAGRVAVIEGGKVVEEGTYDELVKMGGALTRLVAGGS